MPKLKRKGSQQRNAKVSLGFKFEFGGGKKPKGSLTGYIGGE